MNLVTQLHKTAKQNYEKQLEEANNILESVKANLAEQDSKDAEMLKYFGTNKVIIEQNQKVDKVKKIIEGEFITHEDIKNVCLSYNLRCLQTSFYKKEIPAHALNDLRKFRESNDVSEWSMNNSLFIIAPKNHFELGERPKNDPVLLYKEKDIYRIISKWGSDFNEVRRVSAFINRWPNAICFWVIAIVINGILTAGVLFFAWPPELYLLNIVFFFVYAFCMSDSGGFDTLEETWQSPYK